MSKQKPYSTAVLGLNNERFSSPSKILKSDKCSFSSKSVPKSTKEWAKTNRQLIYYENKNKDFSSRIDNLMPLIVWTYGYLSLSTLSMLTKWS